MSSLVRKIFHSKINVAIFLLFGIFIFGILGFRVLSGYSWIDAVYMTVITITTIGFGEVQPLSAVEKFYVSIFILLSIIIVGYALSVISEHLLRKSNIGNLRYSRMRKTINTYEDHVIICGYGRNGRQAALKLKAYNKQFVIIDSDKEAIDDLIEKGISCIEGNATEDEILEEAGIIRASTLLCALPNDSDNLFVVLSAKQLNHNLKIISRASRENSTKKLKLAGADNVIMPDRIGGDHMASLVVNPDLIEFLDNLSVTGEKDSINIEQIAFEFICPDERERSIAELDLRKQTGCSIIGYKSPTGDYIVNPEAKLIIRKDSKLILVGSTEQIRKMQDLYLK